jgi:monoterpene epsilon-lactone hydrolase
MVQRSKPNPDRPMPSFRARAVNRFLRLTTKRLWRPDLDFLKVREHAARMDARLGRRPPLVPAESVTVAGVPATWFGAPELAKRGTLLYLHGGAWCLHLPAMYAQLAGKLSQLTGMRVLLIDYRLAPEHPFPAGIDDCLAVYAALVEQGVAERPFAVAGDSAGGNLTLVTLMRARDALLPMPDCAVALSPSTDLTGTGPSLRYNADADPMFSPVALDLVPAQYCPGQDLGNPLLSPLFGNWNGLPPLLFHAGSTEMLLDDSVRAHDRARQAGVDAQIDVWFGLPHVFHMFRWLPESRAGLADVAAFIVGRALQRPGAASQPSLLTATAVGMDDSVTHPSPISADLLPIP